MEAVDVGITDAFKLKAPTHVTEVHVTAEKQNVSFRVEAFVDGAWKTVSESTDNSDRRIVLRFAPVTTGQLRIVAAAESKSPALCEVRIYENNRVASPILLGNA